MTVRKRSILPRLLIFIVLLVCAAWIWQNYFAYDENGRPPDRYRGDIPTITGTSDADGDGIPDQQDILQGALDYVATRPRYKSAYFVGGWPTDGTGVCTDVVAYGLRAAGYDLSSLVDADKREVPDQYFGVPPDSNIDYRRVPNLAVYFSRHATALTTDTSAIDQWQGGDIVIFDDNHIGIVSDRRNRSGVPYLIHHAYPGQQRYEEDALDSYGTTITGHYRLGTWTENSSATNAQ